MEALPRRQAQSVGTRLAISGLPIVRGAFGFACRADRHGRHEALAASKASVPGSGTAAVALPADTPASAGITPPNRESSLELADEQVGPYAVDVDRIGARHNQAAGALDIVPAGVRAVPLRVERAAAHLEGKLFASAVADRAAEGLSDGLVHAQRGGYAATPVVVTVPAAPLKLGTIMLKPLRSSVPPLAARPPVPRAAALPSWSVPLLTIVPPE